jgi:hypothetical protein
MTSATLRLIALAVAGILIAAGVAVVASNLASRQIGLASEPISAGDELAPPAARPRHHERPDGRNRDAEAGGDSSRESSGGTATSPSETAGGPTAPGGSPVEGTPNDDSGEAPEAGGGERGAGRGDD